MRPGPLGRMIFRIALLLIVALCHITDGSIVPVLKAEAFYTHPVIFSVQGHPIDPFTQPLHPITHCYTASYTFTTARFGTKSQTPAALTNGAKVKNYCEPFNGWIQRSLHCAGLQYNTD